MADNTADGIKKAPGATVETTSQPSDPPVTKASTDHAKDPAAPSIATETATTAATTASGSESAPAPVGQNDAASTKENLTEKRDAADKLASQPEKPTTSQPATTDATQSGAPPTPNGDDKDAPKPATVGDVHNGELPTPAPSQPLEMTGALQPDKAADESSKVDAATAIPKTEKLEASTGVKRKSPIAEAVNGNASANKSLEAQPEKKQKTNGSSTNGGPKKAGRPRKDKSAPPPVGKTARKTRSQGTAD
ncbi:hypothetical protein F5B20DRAFT_475076 [Whalleya microplaca]|nr:hypothetical protein F5B20DRAFT_475076 [Whalleya microplaca]